MNQSYSEYLKSPKWARIRGGVFARDEYKCQCCFQAAKCVHHRRYTANVLDGSRDCLHLLISLCNTCHEYVEFREDGVKIYDCDEKDARLRRRMLDTCAIKLSEWERRARGHRFGSKGGRRKERRKAAQVLPAQAARKSVHDFAREAESLRFDVSTLKRKVLTLETQLAGAVEALRGLADHIHTVGASPEVMRLWNG